MKTIQGMPALGYGTYGRTRAEGQAAIEAALEIGYRHIDTAQTYNTEGECGAALKASGLLRDEVFVTTKVTPEYFGPGKFRPSLEASLETLQLPQVDLTLIHWPSPHEEVPLEVYIEQLAECRAAGLTTHIGVSNFTIDLIDRTRAILGDIPIFTNQFELHPYLQNRKLAAHCQSLDIAVTCYRPIAGGRVNEDAAICAIAEKHGVTPAAITLAHELTQGYSAIPTSGKTDRIRDNFAGLSVTLSDDEMQTLSGLDCGERYIAPDWGPDWD